MNCPYCKSELKIASEAQLCVVRCEICRRHICFLRGVFGLRHAMSEVRFSLPTAIMTLVVCSGAFCVLLSVLVPYLFGLSGAVWIGALSICRYLGVAMILSLVYEGYLSVQTGIMKHKGTLIRGRYAVWAGVMLIGLSIFTLAFLYATFGSVIP